MIYLVFPNPVDEGPQERLWTKINSWGDGVQNMAAEQEAVQPQGGKVWSLRRRKNAG